MQVTFIFIAIISLIILVYSVKLIVKQLNLKEIIVFDLIEKSSSFELIENGIYSICIIGLSTDFKVSELNVNLKLPNGSDTKLSENNFRYSFLRNGKKTVEKWNFKAELKGVYILTLENLAEFLKENPYLTSKKIFSNRKINPISLKILVKQSVPTKHRLISILGLIFGLNGLIWGILIGINPTVLK